MSEIIVPRISTEHFSIGSGLRFAPTYEDSGLPIPPRKRACLLAVAEPCPVKETEQYCDPDNEHHLLYQHNYYLELGGIYRTLCMNPLMIVKMARCRHNSAYARAAHSQYDFVPPPSKDIAYDFNEESRLIRRMERVIREMENQVSPYISGNKKTRYRAQDERVVGSKAAQLGQLAFIFDKCSERVDAIDVIPPTILGRKLTDLHNARKRLTAGSDLLPAPIIDQLAA